MARLSALICAALIGASTATAARSEPIRVAVGSDPAFAVIYHAARQKLFERAGLDVKVTQMTQAADAMDSVAAGQSDIAGGSETTTISRAARAELKALAVFWESGKFIKLTVKDGITDPKQIKKFGIVPGSASELATGKLFAKLGIDPASVTLVRSPPPEIPALLARGDIDGFFLWEPWPTRALKQGARTLMTSGDVGYRATMLAVTSAAWLRAHPAEASTFMKVLSEACGEIHADPERAVSAVQAAIKMPAEDVRNLVKGSECAVRDIAETDVVAFDEVADFLASKKTTPTKISVRPIVEFDFMAKNAKN